MAASVVMCSTAFAQESGTPVECPEQPTEVLPGVYASSIERTITFSKDGETLDFTAGYTGYADESRITCLEETPEFIRRDRLPAPGEFTATGGSCGFGGGGGGAEHVGLSSEWPRMERRMADRIDRFVKEGYPTNSIILHAVSSGLTIDKTVYLMTRADSDRAEEFFTAAFAMQDSLPGWACSAPGATARGGAYSPYYDVNDLPPRLSVAEVARRYFEENRIMEPMPDWFAGDFHMLAYTDELIELAGDDRWYTRGGRSAVENGRLTKPIMISMYGETQDVIIDISRDELLPFRERGVERLPVVFYFNKDFQYPATDVRFDGTLSDAIGLFNSRGAELTPVPWLGAAITMSWFRPGISTTGSRSLARRDRCTALRAIESGPRPRRICQGSGDRDVVFRAERPLGQRSRARARGHRIGVRRDSRGFPVSPTRPRPVRRQHRGLHASRLRCAHLRRRFTGGLRYRAGARTGTRGRGAAADTCTGEALKARPDLDSGRSRSPAPRAGFPLDCRDGFSH
ncbi:MAG: hypothetical protein M5U09_07220 [Gammaproteobacteria bacterium]|nr:hypothetical protein [Gammaproteobacteria bacterium]